MGRSGVSLSIVSGISVCGTSACVALSSIVVAVSSSAGSTFSTISTSCGLTSAGLTTSLTTFGVTAWAMSGVVCSGSATVVESVTTATGVNGCWIIWISPSGTEGLWRSKTAASPAATAGATAHTGGNRFFAGAAAAASRRAQNSAKTLSGSAPSGSSILSLIMSSHCLIGLVPSSIVESCLSVLFLLLPACWWSLSR